MPKQGFLCSNLRSNQRPNLRFNLLLEALDTEPHHAALSARSRPQN